MKKKICIAVKNYQNKTRLMYECDGPLSDWVRSDGTLRDKLSREIADAMQTTEAGGLVVITQEWEV